MKIKEGKIKKWKNWTEIKKKYWKWILNNSKDYQFCFRIISSNKDFLIWKKNKLKNKFNFLRKINKKSEVRKKIKILTNMECIKNEKLKKMLDVNFEKKNFEKKTNSKDYQFCLNHFFRIPTIL